MGKEQRLYERLDFSCPCECALLDTFPESFPATISDIGPQGVGFTARERMKIGTGVLFSIDLGDGAPVKFIVKIRWARQAANTENYCYGAKIFNASPDDLEKIVRFYCKRLAPPLRQKRMILVIESDRKTARALEGTLAAAGYDIMTALDGERGFTEYRSQQPDLIVIAVRLAEVDGIEVRRRIRKLQDDRATPILMLADSEQEARQHAGKYPAAQKFLVKPVKADELTGAVKELLAAPEK